MENRIIKEVEHKHHHVHLYERGDLKYRQNEPFIVMVSSKKSKYKFSANYFEALKDAQEHFDWVLAQLDAKEERKAERRRAKSEERQKVMGQVNGSFKVGQILYDSWGYDQTNIDFYQITEVKEKSIKMRPIGQEMVNATGWLSENVKPDEDHFTGPEETKIINYYMQSDGTPKFYIDSWNPPHK